MTNAFNCIATGIGSLPVEDAEQAVSLSLRYLPEAPLWPQLPKRGFREHMDCQYSESLPGLITDEAKQRISFNAARDLSGELERFFQHYLDGDLGFFGISEAYAAGFHAFLRALRRHGAPKGARYLKGHITGPLTYGTSVRDQDGRDIIHNDLLFDAVVKNLAMKAAWQIEQLKPFGLPVIIFIDEPAMESLGSAFSAVPAETVSERLNEIIDTVHGQGGIAGIHCCGNADWPMLFRTRVDIVNFDAYGYVEKVLLYPGDIRTFTDRGGSLAWGIVPTGSFTGSETADLLEKRLDASIRRLEGAGIDRRTILRQGIITPSCGMGSLTPDKAEAILGLTREISDRMQRRL